MSMGYRSEDSSRSRAGSGRQPARPSSADYRGPDDYSTPGYYADPPGREEQGQYGHQPLSAPSYPDQGYAEPRYDEPRYDEPRYDSGGYDTSRRYVTGRHDTGRRDTGRRDTGRYDTGRGAGNDWYSGESGNGNLTDPYGTPGSQVARDPVRGYPPAPELYPADGYQRFEADQYEQPGSYAGAGRATEQRFHDAPTYADPAYDDRVAYGGAAYDDRAAYGTPSAGPAYGGTGAYPVPYDDAYERAFSGSGYPDPPHDDEVDEASFRDGPEPPGKRPGRRKSGGGSRRPPGLFSRTTLLSVSAGVVAIAVAVASYMMLTKSNPAANSTDAAGPARSQAPAPTAPASAAACASSLGTYCYIQTRTSDPEPLTLAEVFPAQFLNRSDGSSFTEAGQRTDKNCSSAIIGDTLQSSVKSGKCTQVLRASYVSGNGQIMGTIGVVNLATTTAAAKAGKAVDANDFVSPLSTSKGVTKKLGQGTGVVEAEYKGHYLILMWAEYSNLKTPASSHQKHVLEGFEQDLMSGTVNIALSERMVTGKPATTS